MSWIRTILREILGLFVDDGRYALSILLWVGVCVLLLPSLGCPAVWRGPLLFLGLAVLMVSSAARFSRRS